MNGAAFQLTVGLGGLLHGHGVVRAEAEPTIGQQGDRLIQGTGSTVGRGLGEPDAEVSGGRVRQGDDPLGSASQGDRVGQDTVAGRVEHGVHRAQRADPAGHTPAPYRTGVAPSSRASVSSCSPTTLITLTPRTTASCVAMMPTDPPPPNSTSV